MNDRDVIAVLDRAVDALSPRDPDPVGAVIRRVRARRRRIIASAGAVVLLAAAGGVAGVLTTGQGSVRTGPPASGGESGPVRQVSDWAGQTVSVGGVTVPVPDGWTTRVPEPKPPGADCSGTRDDPEDHTVYVLPTAYQEPGDPTYICDDDNNTTYVIVEPSAWGLMGRTGQVQLDPSHQPVWTSSAQRPQLTTMSFPWSEVSVNVFGMDRATAESFLSGVRADDVSADTSGITLPSDMRSASFVTYPRPGSDEFAINTPSWGRDLRAKISALFEGSPSELACVPAPGTVTTTYLNRGSDAPDGSNGEPGVALTFDPTGACGQAFDESGKVVELDGTALHKLLQSHSLNAPVPQFIEPTEPWPAGSGAPPVR